MCVQSSTDKHFTMLQLRSDTECKILKQNTESLTISDHINSDHIENDPSSSDEVVHLFIYP